MEATWSQEGLLGPVVTRPIPQEILPTSRMSCGALTAEALDAAEVPDEAPAKLPGDAPAEVPGEAPAEISKASENAGATGGGPVGTPDATFRLMSLRVVKEVLGRHDDIEKVKVATGPDL